MKEAASVVRKFDRMIHRKQWREADRRAQAPLKGNYASLDKDIKVIDENGKEKSGETKFFNYREQEYKRLKLESRSARIEGVKKRISKLKEAVSGTRRKSASKYIVSPETARRSRGSETKGRMLYWRKRYQDASPLPRSKDVQKPDVKTKRKVNRKKIGASLLAATISFGGLAGCYQDEQGNWKWGSAPETSRNTPVSTTNAPIPSLRDQFLSRWTATYYDNGTQKPDKNERREYISEVTTDKGGHAVKVQFLPNHKTSSYDRGHTTFEYPDVPRNFLKKGVFSVYDRNDPTMRANVKADKGVLRLDLNSTAQYDLYVDNKTTRKISAADFSRMALQGEMAVSAGVIKDNGKKNDVKVFATSPDGIKKGNYKTLVTEYTPTVNIG